MPVEPPRFQSFGPLHLVIIAGTVLIPLVLALVALRRRACGESRHRRELRFSLRETAWSFSARFSFYFAPDLSAANAGSRGFVFPRALCTVRAARFFCTSAPRSASLNKTMAKIRYDITLRDGHTLDLLTDDEHGLRIEVTRRGAEMVSLMKRHARG